MSAFKLLECAHFYWALVLLNIGASANAINANASGTLEINPRCLKPAAPSTPPIANDNTSVQ